MKIFVVSYDELNSKPTCEHVIRDLKDVYNRASEEVLAQMGRQIRDDLYNVSDIAETDIEYAQTEDKKMRQQLIEQCKNSKATLLVTYNLAGFEQETLTDGIAYNLVDCRQFHIINASNPEIEKKIENKVKSINMFFVDNRHE